MTSDDNNPYASPSIPAGDSAPALPALLSEEVRKQLAAPAYGLLVVAAISLIIPLAMAPLNFLEDDPPPSFTGLGTGFDKFVIFVVTTLLYGGFSFVLFRGGLAMRQLRNHSAARWAAILWIAMLGGPLSLGLPFAIWTLVLLRDERLRGAFRPEPIRWIPERKPAA